MSANSAAEDLTRDVRALVGLAASDDGVEDLLRRGLDWLARVVRYDLAAVFLLEGEQLVLRLARGPLSNAQVRTHRLRLEDFPTIREALETRRARAFTAEDHAHGDGDPFDGVLDLPHGHSCMVVPLCAGDRAYGLLTLDRAQCETYPEPVVNLVEVYGQLLALALHTAAQRATLQRLHRQDHAHAKLLEAQLGGEALGILESSHARQMRALAVRARQVAETDSPVLLQGEKGTGKERLARALHLWSRRADQPFVSLHCASVPVGLLEAELFGQDGPAGRPGRFLMANGGTLFLDEVGALPLELQARLLRALQEGTFQPAGTPRTVRADVRVVAATPVPLAEAVAAGRFHEDLYYRLSVFPLSLPPLRERMEDLPALSALLLAEQARRSGRAGARVTSAGLEKLARYDWPGNLRELGAVLERATILTPSGELGPEVLDVPAGRAPPPPAPAVPEEPLLTLEEVERHHIQRVLARCGGRIYGAGGAAQLLGLKPSTLQSRMKKLGVLRPGSR